MVMKVTADECFLSLSRFVYGNLFYSLTRKRAEGGYKKEELKRFDKIPQHKRSLIPLVPRYVLAKN
jgi:hypothetical protein